MLLIIGNAIVNGNEDDGSADGPATTDSVETATDVSAITEDSADVATTAPSGTDAGDVPQQTLAVLAPPPTAEMPTTTLAAMTTIETPTTTAAPTTTTIPSPVDQVAASGMLANPGQLYPGRLGIEVDDHESVLGSGTAYAGWNVYVDNAAVDDGVVTFVVRLFNRSKSVSNYYSFDWSLQHPSGELRGTLILPTEASGSVVSGGTASLVVAFNVEEVSSGEWVYLLHEPDFFDDARGVWGYQVP